MSRAIDVAVVGSGPSGSLAAERLVEAGLRVTLLDVAHDDDQYRRLMPDRSFHEIRERDEEQRRFFLGNELEGVPRRNVRVGAQLTPPRQFVTRDTERLLPVSGEGFDPMQSLALGGLGAAWGAASFTYTRGERERIGIEEPGFEAYYEAVTRRIGVSADAADDTADAAFSAAGALPPLELDTLARGILRSYRENRDGLVRNGFRLGRTPLAVLSRDLRGRLANPYHDMDFWSDARRSVFRPRYVISALARWPRFELVRGALVREFRSDDAGVDVRYRDLASGEMRSLRARRVLLCAGAINSARIALHSLGLHDAAAPILCNPYHYRPCLVPRMLGRAAADRRHSLSQLLGLLAPSDAPDDPVSVQLYGYRSLLLFKLVKELPLPPWAGLLVTRLLVNALCIAGIHHSDAPHEGKTLRVLPPEGEALPAVLFAYEPRAEETRLRLARERALVKALRRLGLLPFARIDAGAASSIHYAGTLPIGEGPGETHADGRLRGAPRVYVGDSAGWRFLPAKGLTFTIMANALRVADHLARDLGSGG